jgi:hypothetical protein
LTDVSQVLTATIFRVQHTKKTVMFIILAVRIWKLTFLICVRTRRISERVLDYCCRMCNDIWNMFYVFGFRCVLITSNLFFLQWRNMQLGFWSVVTVVAFP